MTQTLTAIESAAAKGGESLDQFAKVAGMSSEQFAKTWNEKPIEAVQSFIKGLGELDKKGESATMMLDEMGLSGVRQSNMLKSLALASETMGSAIDTSNKAWEENTALTNEAGIRYETTESKLKMLKNEAVDAAIDLGGPFVDALRDGLEASKPLIATLGDAAKAFSELDPELQRNIVKWTGIAMAAGPALKVLGKVTSTTGKAVTGIGSLSRSIGKLAGRNAEKKALEGLALNSAKLGTNAAGGATKVGGLTTAIGGLNPVVAGTAAALAIGIAGFVVWDKTVGESIRRTNRWGSDIGKEADKSLSKYQEFSDGASNALSNFDTATASTAENAKKNLSAMNEDIAKSAEKLNKDLEKSFNELPKYLQEQTKQTVEERKKSNEESVKLSNDLATQTQAILSKHNGEVSKLTGDERTIVMNNMRQMNSEKVRLMDLSAKEQKQVLAALNGDIDDMTNKQRQTALENLKQFHKDQKQEFMTNNANLKKTLGEDTEEYAQAYKKLSEESKASTLQIAEQMVKLMQANGASTSEIQDQLNGLGLSYWTQQDVIKRASSGMKESNDLIAKSTAGMSNEASKANELWKSLVWDEKKAEVKSNAKEEVTKSIKSADGWNKMKLILKNADLTSNAKEIIFNAIQETGKWNNLPIDPKLLKADNVQLIQKLADSKGSLEEYNNLQPELKTLLADGPAKMTYEETQRALEAYENISPQMKLLLGSNEDVNSKVDTAKANLNSYQMLNPDTKLLKGDNSSVSNAAQQGENSLNSFNSNNPYAKILKGDSTSVQQQSQQGENSLNSFDRNNPKSKTLTAIDNASGPANSAKSAVDSFNWLPNVITKTLKVVKNFVGLEDGTNYHKGGPAVVNDQKGPTYRELVKLPSGEGFIPEGRNVFLDLPRGSKVLKASKTKSLFPHYAEGIGFENTKVASVTSRLKDVQDEGILTTKNNYNYSLNDSRLENVVNKLSVKVGKQGDMMIALLQLIANKEFNLNDDVLSRMINKNNNNELAKILYSLGGSK